MMRIAEKPQLISFSKNPIVFKVHNENNGELIVSVGAKSILTIGVGSGGVQTLGTFEDGQVLSLTITNPAGQTITQNFTFKNVPVGDEIGVAETLEAIFQKIKTHHIVAPYLQFKAINEMDQYLFVAECRKLEPNWSVNWSLSPNPQNFAVQNTLLSITPDVEAFVKVFFEKRYNSGEWNEIFNGKAIITGIWGLTYLNMSDMLDAECLHSLPENPFSHYSRSQSVVANNIRRFYAKFGYQNELLTDDVRYVMLGGTPNRVWLAYQLLQNIELNTSFLTYQPDLKRITRTGIEYMTWFNYTGETQTVSMYVTPYDGTTLGVEYVATQSTRTVTAGLCVTFPIHPQALGVGNSATHYEFQVKSAQGSSLSPKRTLIIDNNERCRFLAYLNAFGVPEIATCTGNLTTRISITAETWTAIRNIQSGVSILKNERLAAKVDKKYTYRSGYLNQKQKEAYTEVALSYRLFDVTTPQYYGLTVVESKTDEIIADDGEKIYAWEWQMQPTIAEDSFAPDADIRNAATLAEPPAFPQGIGSATGITTGLKSFERTLAEFQALQLSGQLEVGIYFITDTDPEQVWFSGGGSAAVNITFGPLRYVQMDNFSGSTITLQGITASSTEDRKRMRFYRGNAEIFITDDFTIMSNDSIAFVLPFDNETFRAFY